MSSETLDAALLGPNDVPAALALSMAAGWNQVADDWGFFIARGHASGLRSPADGLVATAAAVVYGGGLAWVSMVLVAQAWRHRGLASQLLERTLRRVESLNVVPTLDATPNGEPVYRRLGFRSGFAFERWEGRGWLAAGADEPAPTSDVTPRADADADDAPRPATRADVDRIVALDRSSTRLERRHLLHDIVGRAGSAAWLTNDEQGFVISRAGQRATQIGPLVAGSAPQAVALLEPALRRARGAVFIDVPTRCAQLIDWLERHGFVRQRPFLRMSLGTEPPPCDDRQFALAGPEFG